MKHAKGPMLTIDLNGRTVQTTTIDGELASYIGGRAVATKLAHDRIPFDADPLGADNRLYISTGPLQVSQTSFTGRMNMTGLSPLTDGLLSSNAGGYLSRNFADTGYSVVEVTGASDDLVALHVTDEGVEFESVPDLTGATVPEVTEYMETEHGLESENLVTIGPAGENEVRFASVMTYDSRAFGRGGLGAAMGAKNVKSITFEGDSRPEIDIPDVQMDIHREAATTDDIMKRQGTNEGTEFIHDNFSMPTRYFEEYQFEGIDNIDGDAIEKKKYKKGACSVCAFACKLPTRDEETGLETEGPEFETTFSFGTNCAIDDLVSIMKSNELCDRLGMDTVSAGVVVGAYLKSEDEFGNSELVHETLEKIASREGIGDELAEGVDRVHDALGVKNYSVKGLEFAAHDGRVIHGQGLSYAVANRGADHMYSTILGPEYYGEVPPESLDDEKIELLVERENRHVIRDSGVFCAFGGSYISDEQRAELLDADFDELLSIGERVVEMERHFNNQRGMDRADDRLPYELPRFEEALDTYYSLRGWNADGTVPENPTSSVGAAD